MTLADSNAMINSAEMTELIQALAKELVASRRGAPFKIVYTVTGLYMNLVATCFLYKPDFRGDPEGLIRPLDVSQEAIRLAAKIREKSYIQDKGTWYFMRFTIRPDNSATIQFNFDDEPLYLGESLDKIQYALDQNRFPVAPPNQQAWLKSKL